MKKISLAFLFCLTSSIANAQAFQSNKPVVCDTSPEKVIKSLAENYDEKPVWMATGEGSSFTLFVNDSTKSWTLLQYTSEWVCIIGAGTGSKPLLFGQQI